MLSQAEGYLWQSIESAYHCGNPTLILKALLIMRQNGFALPLSDDDIADQFRRLEGEADRAAIGVLTSALIGP